ncbi:hypothetical protein [Leptolyngbya sp. FACHB-261]|uniref:hypothetical protein n=1 Tax=Leptolyngbya sp. FACHB-261 TaxID=2692806 RepID=UPI001686E9D7|nr:hypothetical protein [Leptolyngbya sp. FACHB-261]MBD2103889.1 hypothetical protein [Leptolyngbya sp. FACHB-261]
MQWRASFNRVRIVDWLESFQDLIVISLCLSLFGVIVVQLWVLVVTMIYDASFQEVS